MSDIRVAIFPFGTGEQQNPYQSDLADALERADVDVMRVPKSGRLSGLSGLRNVDVDLVHFDWLDGLYRGRNRPVTLLKVKTLLRDLRRLSLPTTWTIHNIHPHEPPKWPLVDRWVERRVADSMSGFVQFSANAHRTWSERHPQTAGRPWAKVRAGHFIDSYPNSVDQADARRALRVPVEAPLALCFGAIRPYKGFLSFARTFLEADVADALLLIAGPPHDAAEVSALRALAHDYPGRVRVDPEWVSASDVQHYMNAADIGFTPFDSINNSGTVALMQSFGLPMVAPDLAAIRDLACPHNTCFVQQWGVEEIRRGFHFATMRRDHRRPTIEWVRRHQSWDAAATALVSHYLELLGDQSVMHEERATRFASANERKLPRL